MDHYLSVSEIAERLNVTTNTVNSRIRGGNFPPPDATIGKRYQGWLAKTIDQLADDNWPEINDPVWSAQIMFYITELRSIAEIVGAFSPRGGLGHHTSDTLTRLAAATEGFLRGMLRISEASFQRLATIANPPEAGEDQSEPGNVTAHIELEGLSPVPLIVPPRDCPPEFVTAQLRDAAERLEATIDGFKKTSSGSQAITRLVITLTACGAELREQEAQLRAETAQSART